MALTIGRRLAAVGLLAAQLAAGGAVSLVHAREPVDAPRRIESAQHEHCPVLHDAAACVLCSFSHTRMTVPAPSDVTAALPPTSHAPSPVVPEPRARFTSHSGDARAPPRSQA